MRRILFFVCMAMTLANLQGCSKIRIEAAGYTDSISFALPMDFRGIDVESAIEVIFTDTCEEVHIETDANLLPYVAVYEHRGMLKIEYTDDISLKGNSWNHVRTVVKVPYKDGLNALSLSGASVFESDRTLVGTSFDVSASGASTVICTFDLAGHLDASLSGASSLQCASFRARSVYMDASGASSFLATGSMSECEMSLSGASRVESMAGADRYALRIDRCTGDLSGASTAVFASEGVITCSLSGASHIYYKGGAESKGSTVSGGSSIEWDGHFYYE